MSKIRKYKMRKTLRAKNDVEINIENMYDFDNIDLTWSRRNNSENVNSILHPEVLRSTNSKKCGDNKKECYKIKCYCKEKRIKPKLFKKPKPKACSTSTCDLYRYKNYTKNDVTIKNYEDFKDEYQKNKHKCLNESYTPQRIVYENFSKEKNACKCPCYFHSQAEELYRQYFNIKNVHKTENIFKNDKPSLTTLYRPLFYCQSTDHSKNPSKTNQTINESIINITNLEEENTKIHNIQEEITTKNSENSMKHFNSEIKSKDKLENIKNFREKHFFETHKNPSNENTDVEPHKCVFRFSLDDRFSAIPLDADTFGFNRCIICEKPMQQWEKTKHNLKNNSRGPLESLTDLKPRNLTAKQVHLGNNANFEFRLTEKDVQLFNECFKQKIKRPEYKNTFALRQQKMYG